MAIGRAQNNPTLAVQRGDLKGLSAARRQTGWSEFVVDDRPVVQFPCDISRRGTASPCVCFSSLEDTNSRPGWAARDLRDTRGGWATLHVSIGSRYEVGVPPRC